METQTLPRTPPPPYQTLPSTPILTTPSQTRPEQPGRVQASPMQTTPVGYPPINACNHGASYATQHCSCHPVYPHYHHANLIALPFRPAAATHQYVHSAGGRASESPENHAYHYSSHIVPANAASPPVAVAATPSFRPWRSYLHLEAISATLNDAGNLAAEVYDSLAGPRPTREQYGGVLDAVGVRLDNVLTSMDDGTYRVDPSELATSENSIFESADAGSSGLAVHDSTPSHSGKDRKDSRRREHRRRRSSSNHKFNPNPAALARIPGVSSPNPFSKVYHYANAYTSAALPPLKLYFATWPLICLASTYSRRAYEKPSSKERQNFVSGDWRRGTKTVVLKSIPLDEKNTIVLAIRGTQNFKDWAVNVRTEPTAPTGFLDDEGNLCHAGFLGVARKMIKPVAAQLRDLLQENPRRATCSLILTGHSAGGAVAALLYCHMLSQTITSELTELQDLFKRIHCVTFGAPPISLLPLEKPRGKRRYEKNFFFAFVNEGDPVVRADKTYVRSLLELYARADPQQNSCLPSSSSFSPSSSSSLRLPLCSAPQKTTTPNTNTAGKPKSQPAWSVPEATLSLAGRVVVLRTRKVVSNYSSTSSSSSHRASRHDVSYHASDQRKGHKRKKDHSSSSSSSSSHISLEAVTASDADLRGLIFGDPFMHTMDLYAQRVEHLATKAVVGSSAT